MAEKYGISAIAGRIEAPATRSPATCCHPCPEVVPVAKVSFAKLAAYDHSHFFASLEGFLACWISATPDLLDTIYEFTTFETE